MHKEFSKKVVYFLLTMSIFTGMFLVGFCAMNVVEKLIEVHPYVVLVYNVLLLLVDRLLTKKIMYSNFVMNWIQKF